jgi:hypothetical protein
MPIRLNLLAEAQAAEDSRRRDPVKRTIFIAALLVSLMLVWSSSLLFKNMLASRAVNSLEGQMSKYAKDYKVVLDDLKALEDLKQKLGALHQLSESRFLNGNLLNAFQQTNVDDVQLVHLKTEQTYVPTESTKPRTNGNTVIPGKPPGVAEKIVISVEASDASSNPGDQVNKCKEALAGVPYFREQLGKTNLFILKAQSQRQPLPAAGGSAGREGVLFTLDCRLPERIRQ